MGSVRVEIRDSANNIEGALELGDSANFPLALTKRISDFRQLSERSGVFSTVFDVPDTKENNQLLEHLYDANKKLYKDNWEDKTAIVFVDDLQVEIGTLRVELVETSGDQNEKARKYKCKFFGNNSEWVIKMGEKFLSDLPYESSSIVYDIDTVSGSWDNTYTDEWVFSLIQRGERTAYQKASVEEFYPDLFLRTVIDKAFESVGFTVESDFFDTAAYKKLILTYFGTYDRDFRLAQSVLDNAFARATRITSAETGSLSYGGAVVFDTDLLSLNNDTTAPGTDPGGNYDTGTFQYTVPHTGEYKVILSFHLDATGTTGPINNDDVVYMCVVVNGFFFIIDPPITFSDLVANASATNPQVYTRSLLFFNSPFVQAELNAGDIVEAGLLAFNLAFNPVPKQISWRLNTGSYMEVVPLPRILEGTTFTLNDVLDSTQMPLNELMSDLTKLDNLYWRTNNAIKRVYVEPQEDFYQSLDQADDWTNRLDVSRGWKIEPASKFFEQRLRFEYANDSKDGYVAGRNENEEFPIGAYEQEFGNLKEGTKLTQLKHLAATWRVQDFQVTSLGKERAPIVARLWSEFQQMPTPLDINYAPRVLNYEYGTQQNLLGQSKLWNFESSSDLSDIPYCLPHEVRTDGLLRAAADVNLFFNDVGTHQGRFSENWAKAARIVEEGYILTAHIRMSVQEFKALDFTQPVYFEVPEEISGYWTVESVNNFKISQGVQIVEVVFLQRKAYEPVTINTIETGEEQTKGGSSGSGSGSGAGLRTTGSEEENRAAGRNNTHLGYGLRSYIDGQVVAGRFNDPTVTADASTDVFQIGAGLTDAIRDTPFRVRRDGTVIINGVVVGPGDGVERKTADFTAEDITNTYIVETSGGDVTATIPTAVGREGKEWNFKKQSQANFMTLTAESSAETIDGSRSRTYKQLNTNVATQSDGENYWTL